MADDDKTPAPADDPAPTDDPEAAWTRLGSMIGEHLSPIAERLAKLEAAATAPKDDKHGKTKSDDDGKPGRKRDDDHGHQRPLRRRILDIL